MSTERNATLTVDGKTVEFPVMTGTHGNDVIDIRTLGAKTGLFTYDSGFLSTASCASLSAETSAWGSASPVIACCAVVSARSM